MMRVKQILLNFAREHKWRYVAGFIFLIINSVITSLVPKIIGAITDSIAEARPASVIYKYVLLLLLSAFGTFIFRFIWRYLIIGNSRNLECHLRAKLFKHLQTLPVNFYNNNKTGDLVAYAINDIQAIRRTLAFGLVGILDGVVINSISIWLMIETINPVVSLMALAPAPLVVLIIIVLRKKIREKFGEVQKAFAIISEKVQENITGIRVIKAFAQEQEEMDDFTKYSKHRIDTQMKLTRVSAALGPITQICFGLSFVFFIIYGSDLVARGIISLGDFVAFNTYIGVIMRPIINVGRIVEIWQQGIASGKRLDEIFSVESESDLYKIEERYNRINSNNKKLNDGDINEDENRKKDLIKLKGRIEFKNLNFTYPGTTKRVLKDINLELKEGQTLGILGKTGSGKTTLVNLLLKLYEVDNGHIFIDDKDINEIPSDILRENIGYVPQDNFLFSTSIKENIEFFRPIYDDEEIIQASKLAGVYEDIISFPDGFNMTLITDLKGNIVDRKIDFSSQGQDEPVRKYNIHAGSFFTKVTIEQGSSEDSSNNALIEFEKVRKNTEGDAYMHIYCVNNIWPDFDLTINLDKESSEDNKRKAINTNYLIDINLSADALGLYNANILLDVKGEERYDVEFSMPDLNNETAVNLSTLSKEEIDALMMELQFSAAKFLLGNQSIINAFTSK